MKRITLRDIAERVGLSCVAVSLALRDHPSLPERTKEKIRKAAAELGYRRDPVLDALNAYRHANRGFHYQATLAWIIPSLKDQGQYYTQVFEGAQERAEALGFHLEAFAAPAYADWMRLVRTLRSRRIQGLLLHPAFWSGNPDWDPQRPESLPWRNFPWEDFSAIAIGQIFGPAFHLVINNQFQSAALATRELHALGYRKIGIVMPSIFARNSNHQFLGGYLSECAHLKIPPLFLLDEVPGNKDFMEHAAKWVLRYRPEAVIASGDGDILPALHAAKLEIPHDIAVAVLCRMSGHPELAGIEQNFRHIGEVATHQLVDLIRRNERGVPAFQLRHLVEGTWMPGPSAPPKQEMRPSWSRPRLG